jgi:hypothetical protein
MGERLSRYAKSNPEIEFMLSLVAGGGAREAKKVAVSTVGKTLLEDRGKKSWRIVPQKSAGW